MAAPNYLSNGAYTRSIQATNVTMMVVCPASVSAGNLLLLVYGQRSVSTGAGITVAPPAAWTAVGSTLSVGSAIAAVEAEEARKPERWRRWKTAAEE